MGAVTHYYTGRRERGWTQDRPLQPLKGQIHNLQNGQQPYDNSLTQGFKNKLQLEWEGVEIFWRQKPLVEWLKQGDENARFFHALEEQPRARNRVTGIQNSNGEWISALAGTERFWRSSKYTLGPFFNPGTEVDEAVRVVPTKVTNNMDTARVYLFIFFSIFFQV